MRFHAEEVGHIKQPDSTKIRIEPQRVREFRDQLSQLGNCFINDAFGTVHRSHSSVIGINHKHRVAGLLMQK